MDERTDNAEQLGVRDVAMVCVGTPARSDGTVIHILDGHRRPHEEALCGYEGVDW